MAHPANRFVCFQIAQVLESEAISETGHACQRFYGRFHGLSNTQFLDLVEMAENFDNIFGLCLAQCCASPRGGDERSVER